MSNPIEQFEVKRLIPLDINGVDVSVTNASFFMVLATVCALFFMWFMLRKQLLIPSTGQSFAEAIFSFIKSTAQDTIGHGYEKFLPFVFSVFIMVLFGNLLGLMPYGFTFTSQLAPVGVFAVFGLLVSAVVGLKVRGLSWFRTFLPTGIPLIMAPLIIPIEIISFLAKPFSLTVRLVMNMVVGHVLLKILAGFVYSAGIFGVLPMVVMGILILFEVFIACLQAYIYAMLTSIYLGEAVHSH